MAETENYRKGKEVRRQLLGDAYVEQADKNTYTDPNMRKFIDLATETTFGAIWTPPGLDLKTRTLSAWSPTRRRAGSRSWRSTFAWPSARAGPRSSSSRRCST